MDNTAIYFVTGSSGSEKTTLLKEIEGQLPNDIVLHHFDDEGIYDLEYWFSKVSDETAKLHIFDGSIRPSDILSEAQKYSFDSVKIVLVDCGHAEREHRLVNLRKQPELDTLDMYAWAAYLRGQADVLKLELIDTTSVSIEESSSVLQKSIEDYYKLLST